MGWGLGLQLHEERDLREVQSILLNRQWPRRAACCRSTYAGRGVLPPLGHNERREAAFVLQRGVGLGIEQRLHDRGMARLI